MKVNFEAVQGMNYRANIKKTNNKQRSTDV